MRYPSASRLERVLACPASHVLPQKPLPPSPYAKDGTQRHEALRLAVEGESVRQHAAWAQSVLEAAGDWLLSPGVEAEVALLWDMEWGAAEVLGRNIGRNYGDAMSRGYVGSADYLRAAGDVVEVVDLKTGRGEVTEPHRNPQLLLLALAAARHHRAQFARVGLLLAPEGSEPRMVWGDEVTSDGLAAFAARLDELPKRVASAATDVEAHLSEGLWCRYCPARAACPRKAKDEEMALALPKTSRIVVTEANAGEVWEAVDRAREVLDELKTACVQVALRTGGVRMPNGLVRRQVSHETEALDAQSVWDALAARWGVEVAKAGVGIEASKASVLRAVKEAKAMGATGAAAALQREVLDAVRAAGGVKTRTRTEWEDQADATETTTLRP